MRIAINVDGKRVDAYAADNSGQYKCPICKNKVVLKQGKINAWHFAHESKCTDSWYYEMSEWHKRWQDNFPEENREIIVKYENEIHRADVLIGEYVLEFQYSSISSTDFEERNAFYRKLGYKVIWVFNFENDYLSEKLTESDNYENRFLWNYAPKIWCNFTPQDNKDIMLLIELCTYDEDGNWDPFIKKITSAYKDGEFTSYKTFYVDEINSVSLNSYEDIKYAFLNKWQRFYIYLEKNKPYKEKCSRMKGNPLSWYKCEKTKDWHNDKCETCSHNLITEYRKSSDYKKGGKFFHCKYPEIVHVNYNDVHFKTPSIST